MDLAEDEDFLVEVPVDGIGVVDEVPQDFGVVRGGHDDVGSKRPPALTPYPRAQSCTRIGRSAKHSSRLQTTALYPTTPPARSSRRGPAGRRYGPWTSSRSGRCLRPREENDWKPSASWPSPPVSSAVSCRA